MEVNIFEKVKQERGQVYPRKNTRKLHVVLLTSYPKQIICLRNPQLVASPPFFIVLLRCSVLDGWTTLFSLLYSQELIEMVFIFSASISRVLSPICPSTKSAGGGKLQWLDRPNLSQLEPKNTSFDVSEQYKFRGSPDRVALNIVKGTVRQGRVVNL